MEADYYKTTQLIFGCFKECSFLPTLSPADTVYTYHCFEGILPVVFSVSNMTGGIHLCIVVVLALGLRQLAAYPYSAGYNPKDNWNYPLEPLQYNTQLDRSPNQNKIKIASSNNEQPGKEDWRYRYLDYASEAKYYSAYDRKNLQAAERALILDHIAEANAKTNKGEQGMII